VGEELLPELTDEEKQLLDDPELTAQLCRVGAYRRMWNENKQLRAEVERLKNRTCEWTWNEDNWQWESDCGAEYSFAEDNPSEDNLSRFCPDCGGRIVVISDSEEE